MNLEVNIKYRAQIEALYRWPPPFSQTYFLSGLVQYVTDRLQFQKLRISNIEIHWTVHTRAAISMLITSRERGKSINNGDVIIALISDEMRKGTH